MHLGHYSAQHLNLAGFRVVYVYFDLSAASAAAEEIDRSQLDKLVVCCFLIHKISVLLLCIHGFLFCIFGSKHKEYGC